MVSTIAKTLNIFMVLEGVCIYFCRELDFERVPSAISRHIIVLNVGFFSRNRKHVGLEANLTAGPSQRSTVQHVEPYIARVNGEYARFRQQMGIYPRTCSTYS